MTRKQRLDQLSLYYRSPYWNRVRGALLYERGGRCEDCGSTAWLQCHHLTYAHLFTELSHLKDLRLLCRSCHELAERKKKALTVPHPKKSPLRKPKRDLFGRFVKRRS